MNDDQEKVSINSLQSAKVNKRALISGDFNMDIARIFEALLTAKLFRIRNIVFFAVFISMLMPGCLNSWAGNNGESHKVDYQRFGIDGGNPKWAHVVAELGDGWSGINTFWASFEPKPPRNGIHFYKWKRLDAAVRSFQRVGRRLQVNVRVFSRWALDNHSKMKVRHPGTGKRVGAIVRIKPEHVSDWASFITALVERYDNDGKDDMPGLKYPVSYFQIESEPENVWADIDGYIQALATAYEAAKKADPEVHIMAGGFNVGRFFVLSKKEKERALRNARFKHKWDFINGFFPRGENYFDILSLNLNNDYEVIPPTVKWYQEQMRKNGYQKPIWAGDMSSGPMLSKKRPEERRRLKLLERKDPKTLRWYQQEQAMLLVKKAVTAFASGVDKVFITSDVDWTNYYLASWRNQGLLTSWGKRKPAFYSFKTMVAKLDGFVEVETLSIADGVYAYKFTKPSGDIYVLWSESGKTVSLPIKTQKVVVTDISGKTSDASPESIKVGRSPVFVEAE